jgi:DUF177 domain-containing protein
MPVGLLDRVRFHELAERGAQITGGVPLTTSPRLAALVEADSAEIEARLNVVRHDSGIPLVRGEIDAALSMPCQRCLDPVRVTVHVTMKLAVVADETQLVPDAYEPFISIDGVGRLADLVEEEILLALPEYPVHESVQACGELVARVLEHEQAPSEQNPFAVLRKLETDHD